MPNPKFDYREILILASVQNFLFIFLFFVSSPAAAQQIWPGDHKCTGPACDDITITYTTNQRCAVIKNKNETRAVVARFSLRWDGSSNNGEGSRWPENYKIEPNDQTTVHVPFKLFCSSRIWLGSVETWYKDEGRPKRDPNIICGKVGTGYLTFNPSENNVSIYDAQNRSIAKVSVTKWMHNSSSQYGNFIRCNDDILIAENYTDPIGGNYVTVRNGRELNIFYLIGISPSNEVSIFRTELLDGMHHGVSFTPEGPIIKLGRNKDVFVKYCFDGSSWTSSEISRSGAPTSCTRSPIAKFQLPVVQMSPQRGPPQPDCPEVALGAGYCW